MLQVHSCSPQYLEFTVTFSLFYLFDWKFVDQMNFSFLQGKIASDLLRARAASGAQFVQA